MKLILDYLAHWTAVKGNQVFISENGVDYTFEDIYNQVQKLAFILKENGVEQGDRIVIFVAERTQEIIGFLASIKVGAITVQTIVRSWKFALFAAEETQSKFVLTVDSMNTPANIPGDLILIHYNDLTDHTEKYTKREYSEVATIMFTSGTTGKPKGTMLTHQNLMTMGTRTKFFGQIDEQDRELVNYPLSTTSGMSPLHAHLISGSQILLIDTTEDPKYFLSVLASERITGILISPWMLKAMSEADERLFIRVMGKLKYILTSYTPIRPKLVKKILDGLPNTIFCSYYGMTEASRSAYNIFRDNPDKLACSGIASPDGHLKINNPDHDGIGEICMKGPNTLLGYWNDNAATKLVKDEDDWVHSGDLGFIDEDGFVTVLGRLKEQINIDGWKCQPKEVEETLNSHPLIKTSAVVAVPDVDKYQVVGAAIVLEEGVNPKSLSEKIKAFCKERKADYKVPRYIMFVDEIPVNTMGKTQRIKIREDMIAQFEITLPS
ncbi:MAG: class I adenylate-forming enzyme family protein [Bacteroidota bacterium]